MRPGAQVYGYFPPSVVRLDPNNSVSRKVRLAWPHPLDQLWNAERWAAPGPGEYQVSVQIGYGLTPEPGPPDVGEGVEDPVLRWQREEVSPAVQMEVPPYPLAAEEPE